MTEEIQWLVPPVVAPLTGGESFIGIDDVSVRDFWQFALGDLRMNNARGYLAEFMVGKALGLQDLKRIEWDAYDLCLDGITIEVKSSAYLQSWEQQKVSALSFSGLYGTRYHSRPPGTEADPLGKRLNATVYVFCAHTISEHEKYNQLDIGQWEFYVVSRSAIAATGFKTLSLRRVRELSKGAIGWDAIESAVRRAAIDQERADDDPSWWKKAYN